MNDSTKPNPFAPIIYFFSRYNLLVFIVIIATGLSVAILTLSSILQIPYTSDLKSSSSSITFDETTISQIRQLNESAQNNTIQTTLQSKASPFFE